jgi:SAM-dependent methyltransferase
MTCPSCGSGHLSVFYEVGNVPAHSCVLLPTQEAAVGYPTGSVLLAFCSSCGFITNVDFDPGLIDYTQDYEETQGFSGRFSQFARSLAERLIDRFDVRGKDVLEIGCGKGEFLVLLCELGNNRGVGIDPSYVPERLNTDAEIKFIRDYYSERSTDLTGDLICCRHTLEHIGPTGDFVRLVRRSAERTAGAGIFVEVPDVRRVLRECAFWDIYHEHCSYFSPGSLARLFRSTGFEVLDLTLDFDDQYILLESRLDEAAPEQRRPLEEPVEELAADVEAFRRHQAEHVERWRNEVWERHSRGERIVLWGSGSKGVAFLTTLGLRDEIEHVVDINPFRHGMYMPGTGQRIVSPEFLQEYRPQFVVAMNPIYIEEIRRDLDRLGVSTDLIAIDALMPTTVISDGVRPSPGTAISGP